MKRLLVVAAFLAASSFSAVAQVCGRVVDTTTGNGVVGVLVSVLSPTDSTVIDGCITDEAGRFSVSDVSVPCLLNTSCVGYKDVSLMVKDNDSILVSLTTDTLQLDEVIVKGKTFRLTADGFIVNVNGSIYSKLGTAVDVLGALPMVKVSNDTYTVKGRGEAVIYIDNHLLRDNAELNEMNSADIKSVKIIRLPGAEYYSSVKSVIRISTIHREGEGLGGSVFANTSIDKCFSYLTEGKLNYRYRKLDVFGSISHNETNNKFSQTGTTKYNGRDNNDNIELNGRYKLLSTSLGTNWQPNDRLSVGATYKYSRMLPSTIEASGTLDSYLHGNLMHSSMTNNKIQLDNWKHYWNAYLEYILPKGATLKFDLDHVNIGGTHVQKYTVGTETVSVYDDNSDKLYSVRGVVNVPFGSGELSTGIEASYTDTRNNSVVKDNDILASELSTSSNEAQQTLLSCFAEYSKKFGQHWNASVGLRNENIVFDYFINSVKDNATSYRHSKIFPTASLAYGGGDINMSLQCRYSVIRPSYYALRNTVAINNTYEYEGGNPKLKSPERFELSFATSWKDLLLDINYTSDRNAVVFIASMYENSDSIVFFHTDNVKRASDLDIMLTYTPTWFKVWHPTIDAGVTMPFATYNNVKYNKPMFYCEFNNKIELGKSWIIGNDMQFTTRGNIKELVYQYSDFQVSLFAIKSFYKDRLRVNMKLSNLFDRYIDKQDITTNGIQSMKRGCTDNSRAFSISLTYRFNPSQSKYKGKASSVELNRL